MKIYRNSKKGIEDTRAVIKSIMDNTAFPFLHNYVVYLFEIPEHIPYDQTRKYIRAKIEKDN